MKINKGIAVGLAVSVVLVSVVSAQYVLQPSGRIFQAGAPLFPAQAFAPHPRTIVNLDSHSGLGGSTMGPLVSAPTPLTIYEVPADKYFVLTTWSFDGANYWVLSEDFAGMETVKLSPRWNDTWNQNSNPYTFSPLGLVFQPGSNVVIRKSDLSPSTVDLTYNAVGYLVDP